MISCKEVYEILLTEPELSFWKSMQLKMHVMMCDGCAGISEQIESIKKNSRELFLSQSMKTDKHIQNLEQRILEALLKARIKGENSTS